MKKPRIPVALEGFPFIFFAAFATLTLALAGCFWTSLFGLAVTAFVLYFFRDPLRFVPAKAHCLVSPADGKVIAIEKLKNDEILGHETIKISIFMNIFNVHVNRMPLAGRIEKIEHIPGKFYSADSEKGAMLNEKCITVVEGPHKTRVAFVQVAGLIARRIVNWLEVGDKMAKGERFGLIRFGSRVDIHIPSSCAIGVKEGNRVVAGETIIAYLNS